MSQHTLAGPNFIFEVKEFCENNID